MGIESTFACNILKDLDLAEKSESRFRTLGQSMVSGVSHAQRPPRQRLRCAPGMFNRLEVPVLYPT
jgi:hypothetical protein